MQKPFTFFLGPFLPGDVACDSLHENGRRILVEYDLCMNLHRNHGAIPVEQFRLEHNPLVFRPPGHLLLHQSRHLREVLLVAVVGQTGPDELFRRVAENLLDGRVDIGEGEVRGHGPDDVQSVLSQQAVSLLARPRLFFRPFALGHVGDYGGEVGRLPLLIPHQADGQAYPHGVAVLPQVALLHRIV